MPWIIAVAAFTLAAGCIPSCNIAHVRPERPAHAAPEAHAIHPIVSSQLPAQQLVPEHWWIDGVPALPPAPAIAPWPDLFMWDVPLVLPEDAPADEPDRQPLLAPIPFTEPQR